MVLETLYSFAREGRNGVTVITVITVEFKIAEVHEETIFFPVEPPYKVV